MTGAPEHPRIAELPAEQRPRERLLRAGGAALSDAELIAVLLRTGRPGRSVLTLAADLLAEHGGLAGLLIADPEGVRGPGLGRAKRATLLAAIELGRRLARRRIPNRRPLDRPDTVAAYLTLRYARRDQEVMGALFVDVRGRLLGETDLFRGTLSRAAVEPRAILKEALLRGASGYVLFHNHPSGDPAPSAEDLEFTRRLAEASELVGVRLIDHLILAGAGQWVSLARRGVLPLTAARAGNGGRPW